MRVSQSTMTTAACACALLLCACGDEPTTCTIETGADSARTLRCSDGTSASLDPQPESGCTVTDEADGGHRVTCSDGTSVVIYDGAPGAAGAPGSNGEDGSSCTVTDLGQGAKQIRCADGTEVIVMDGAAGTGCSVASVQPYPALPYVFATVVACADGTRSAPLAFERRVPAVGRPQVSAGANHACALDVEGAVRCFGGNTYGQLGYGNTVDLGMDRPAGAGGVVAVGGPAVQIDAGALRTCVLLASGAVRCFGRGDTDGIGYGNMQNIGDDELPESAGDIMLGGKAVQISAGNGFTCALLERGAVRCFGRGSNGELGYGNTASIGDDELPASAGDVALGGPALQVVTGRAHACALLEGGSVRCWGSNTYGQLGYGNGPAIGDDETPDGVGPVPLGSPAIALAAGDFHTCALLAGGRLRCWGFNAYGQLGYGHTRLMSSPASVDDVAIGGEVVAVTAGEFHTCALVASGALRCFGQNRTRQLGYADADENIGDDEMPVDAGDVPLAATVAQVDAGWLRTCVMTTAGDVECFGNNVAAANAVPLTLQCRTLAPLAVAPISPSADLRATYFDLAAAPPSALPDFATLGSGTVTNVATVSLPPGAPDDDFALQLQGHLWVAAPGLYTLKLTSDDGSRLRINDEVEINNDGLHGVQSGATLVCLSSGWYALGVDYFESQGDESLALEWAAGPQPFAAVGADALFGP